jgi:hypothetical protein
MPTDLTIITPMLEEETMVKKWLEGNRVLFGTYPLWIYDSGMSKLIETEASRVLTGKVDFWVARRILINEVKTSFLLNLDADTLLPIDYVQEALVLLKDPKIAVIAIDYEELMGHLSFGTSVWKTKVLQELYNWPGSKVTCECIYMWGRIHKAGLKMETLNMRAKHLILGGV